jgi:hypothetical protein
MILCGGWKQLRGEGEAVVRCGGKANQKDIEWGAGIGGRCFIAGRMLGTRGGGGRDGIVEQRTGGDREDGSA